MTTFKAKYVKMLSVSLLGWFLHGRHYTALRTMNKQLKQMDPSRDIREVCNILRSNEIRDACCLVF